MQTGEVIDNKYRIDEVLGEGATSVVYKAHDIDLGQTVVVKMLRPELLSVPAHRERFVREASISAYFVSQHAVAVRDIAAVDNTMYLVLDYHPGATLASLLRSRRFTRQQIQELGQELLLCLCDAHRQGIRHGDIKPANLLLSEQPNGRMALRLLDFGLASLHGEKRQCSDAGTLVYLAPEQLLREQTDARSDIYAAAVCIYHLATGSPPWQPASTENWAYQVTCHRPAPLSQKRADVPRAVDKVVLNALAAAPEERYQTAAEFLAAWQQAWQLRRHRTSRLLFVAGAALLLACTVCTCLHIYRQRQSGRQALQQARAWLQQQEYGEADRLARLADSHFPQQARDIRRAVAIARLATIRPEDVPAWLDEYSTWADQEEDVWLRDYLGFYHYNWHIGELARRGDHAKAAVLASQRRWPERIAKSQAQRLPLAAIADHLERAIRQQDVAAARRHLQGLKDVLTAEAVAGLEQRLSSIELVATYEKLISEKRFREAIAMCAPLAGQTAWAERAAAGKRALQEWLREASAVAFPTAGALLGQKKITVRGAMPPADYAAGLLLQGMPVPVTTVSAREWQAVCELPEGRQELTLIYRDIQCEVELARWPVTVDTTPPQLTVERVALAADGSRWLFTGKVQDAGAVTVETLGKPFFRNTTQQAQTWTYTVAAGLAPARLVFIARDDAGNDSESRVELPQDNTPPTLTIESPAADSWCYTPRVTMRGRVEDASGVASLIVAGKPVAWNDADNGSWQTEVELPSQVRVHETHMVMVAVEAVDRAGNKASLLLPLRCRYVYWQSLSAMLAMKLHDEKIWGMVFSPTGDFLVCAGNDQKMHAVRSGSWQVVRSFDGNFAVSYDFTITPAIFFASPIMEQMTKESKDKFWQHMEVGGVWQVSATALQQSPYRFVGEFCQPQVRQIAVSPDFSRFAVGDRNGHLKLVVRKETPEIWTHKAHQGGVLALCFSASGRWLASGGGDNIVKVWDAQSGLLCMSLEGHTMPVTALSFGEQEQVLASGSRDKKIALWSMREGALIASKPGNTSSITAITFDPQGQLLVSGNYNGEIVVWGKRK